MLVSPIAEACPTERKEASMSLLHSFYCWGCMLVIIGSTVFFTLVGMDHWRTLACLWAIIPLPVSYTHLDVYKRQVQGDERPEKRGT